MLSRRALRSKNRGQKERRQTLDSIRYIKEKVVFASSQQHSLRMLCAARKCRTLQLAIVFQATEKAAVGKEHKEVASKGGKYAPSVQQQASKQLIG